METFLKKIAHRIATEQPRDTDRVLVVFNNNRSKRVFLNHFMSEVSLGFLPQVMTFDELVLSLGGLQVVPGEFLLFELYNIHIQLGGDERKYQTFEDFISFGDLMVSDFSEVDQYMVAADKLFAYISSEKDLDAWDVEGGQLTDFQRRYLDFYHSLHQYYTLLRQRLFEQGKAYSGMAYRHVAEHIAQLADPCPWQAVYFVGFNAMSRCELAIIDHYVRQGVGHTLTDYDTYYLDEAQEAGRFLRQHMERFPELRPSGPSIFGQGKREVAIVECPETLLQCKYAAQLLSEKQATDPQFSLEDTAVVLADERLLMPVLNALPYTVDKLQANISMGYAYADSMVHALALKLFSLYRQHTAQGYYHTDLQALLSDRHISAHCHDPDLGRKTEHYLRSGNRIRCTGTDLQPLLPDATLHFLFPDTTPAPQQCLDILRQLATLLAATDLMAADRKETQALGSLVEVLDNLCLLHSTYPFITNTDTLEKIYTRLAQHHQIDLIGQPMKGLQILGMLETRNLDFRHVILLSACEGIVPGGRGGNTLVPQRLKHEYGLPTYDEKDSVYAFNFYRLLHRAGNVYLFYSSEVEEAVKGKGEPSRFIRQVERELAPAFGIEVKHYLVGADTKLTAGTPPPLGRKTEAVVRRLSDMAASGLSPTSFSDFVDCPLKFHLARVLRINERDTLDDDLDAAELGSAVHHVLQRIYDPLLGRPLREADMQAALDAFRSLLHEEFEERSSHGRSTAGRNHFLRSVAESQLHHLLGNELDLLRQGHSIEVLATEEDIDPYPLLEQPARVMIKGTVDRVDIFDGTLRIIDYKTGSLTDKEITYAEPLPGKWLQLMWYALVYTKAHPSAMATGHGALTTGIYPLRNLRSDVRLARWDGDTRITPDRLHEFEQMLREKAEELMNPGLDFVATPSASACRFCPAAAFCDSAVH